MDKKRLLELAGVPLADTAFIVEQGKIHSNYFHESAVRAATDWFLEIGQDVYRDLHETGELPGTTQELVNAIITDDLLDGIFDGLKERVRENALKELPPLLKTLRRDRLAQKRRERE